MRIGVGADLLRGLKPVLVINSELVLAISVNPPSVNPEGGTLNERPKASPGNKLRVSVRNLCKPSVS